MYNGGRYLAQALESLLNQTFTDFELVISDNASTDETQRICEQFAARDSRVRYFRTSHNRGAAWNFVRVVQLATAPYFKWASHDDFCAPTFLERCVEVLDGDPGVVLCYSSSVVVDEEGRVRGPYQNQCKPTMDDPYARFREVVYRLRLCHMQFGVMRSEVLRQTRLIEGYGGSDYVLLGDLALRGRFVELPDRLFFRRIHPQMSSAANPSHEALANWFNPTATGKPVLVKGRRFIRMLGVIRRAPVRRSIKLRCYALALRWGVRRRHQIGRELLAGLGHLRLKLRQ